MILHQLSHLQTPSQSSQGESTKQTKAKCPSGFRELILPLQGRAPSKHHFWGVGGFVREQMLQPSCVCSPLAGFESRSVWAGPIRSGGSLSAPSGFSALSSPPTLWYLLSREREREKNYLFLMPQKPHVLTHFGRETCLKCKSCVDPSSSRVVRF